MSNSQTVENYTSSEFLQLWQGLTHNQRRFAVAMLECSNKKEAAELVGLTPQTVYRWPETIDKVVEYLLADVTGSVTDILHSNAVKAAMIKVGGLDASEEKTRLETASEVLDRVIGRPTAKTELSGPDGGAIEISDKFKAALGTVYGGDK